MNRPWNVKLPDCEVCRHPLSKLWDEMKGAGLCFTMMKVGGVDKVVCPKCQQDIRELNALSKVVNGD